MKPKTMILMVVAVTCGLGASYMTSRLLAERHVVTEEQEKVVILVAKKNLETGVTIKDPRDFFVEKAVVKGEEPKSAVTKHEDLKGRVLKHALREGDFVSAGDVLSDRESWLAYMLPKGHRAVGVRVKLEEIASGFSSLPLSRVDIISTVTRSGQKGYYSQVLLQNVLVLAADMETVRHQDRPAMPATVVTVALTPEQALKVTLAKELGPLTLVLRKFNDNQFIDRSSRKMTMDGLGGRDKEAEDKDDPPPVVAKAPEPKPAKAPAPAVAKAPPAPKTWKHVVTVLAGLDQKQVEYTLDEKDEVVSFRVLPHEGLHMASPPPVASAAGLTNPPAPTPAETKQ